MRCMCWICWGEAYRKGIYGDWDDLVCFNCGRYKISRRFLGEHVGKKFDVAAMRERFQPTHDRDLVPIVDSHTAVFQSRAQQPLVKGELVGWPAPAMSSQRLVDQ
ncbi:hypothetical protein DMX04_00405 [Pseudomonas koreensis]|nr:hypothetical protein DMX04_00405 [Pseudomonas koreensis]